MAEGRNATVRRITQLLTTRTQRDKAHAMSLSDLGHGVDEFGLNRDWVGLGMGLMRGLYDHWFRVRSVGCDQIPKSGAAILAANHSGTLPFDAAMLWMDVVQNTSPPRVPRIVADHFVPNLPFVSTLFARSGAVNGSRANLSRLLDRGELVGVFPEGTPGIGKHFRERYQLKTWRVGHVELALKHNAPVVPIGIVGAEEQMPQVGRIDVGSKLFGAPYLPITLTPFPLPVRYHVLYGAPIHLHELLAPCDPADPAVLERAANIVSGAVRELVDRGLADRKGIFR